MSQKYKELRQLVTGTLFIISKFMIPRIYHTTKYQMHFKQIKYVYDATQMKIMLEFYCLYSVLK